jgi:hypothetical protein
LTLLFGFVPASFAQLFECRGDPQSQPFICSLTAGRELVSEQAHLDGEAGRISGPCLPDRLVEIWEPLPRRVIVRQQSGIQRRADSLPFPPEIVQVARH